VTQRQDRQSAAKAAAAGHEAAVGQEAAAGAVVAAAEAGVLSGAEFHRLCRHYLRPAYLGHLGLR